MNRIKLSKMKKKYQKPAFDVVVLKRRAFLLQSVEMRNTEKKSYQEDVDYEKTWE